MLMKWPVARRVLRIARPSTSVLALVLVLPWMAGCRKNESAKQRFGPSSPEAIELGNAVSSDDAPAIDVWISKGRDPDVVFLDGGTVLHAAAGMGHVASVKALLRGGADPNMPKNDGRTPLHQAAIFKTSGQCETVTILLKAGADPNVKDASGRTAIDYAIEEGNSACASLLPMSSATTRTNSTDLSAVPGVSIVQCQDEDRSGYQILGDGNSAQASAENASLSKVIFAWCPFDGWILIDAKLPEARYDIRVEAPEGQAIWPLAKRAFEEVFRLRFQPVEEPSDVWVLQKSEDPPHGLTKTDETSFRRATTQTAAGLGYEVRGTMDDLLQIASEYVDEPVVDETGLRGCYQFTLNMDRRRPETLSTGIAELGLKLERAKRKLPVLRVVSAEAPSGPVSRQVDTTTPR